MLTLKGPLFNEIAAMTGETGGPDARRLDTIRPL